ncbi:CYTH domain-containing protein [Micavibrio aeruginosavorus]|uniref:CYTH domain-containing protein n=1 Tax=Micavibrio aeruginosavorus TaxID=349221 RepID=UPI003F4AA00F
MMKNHHLDLTDGVDTSPNVKQTFNDLARKVCEVEIKFLVPPPAEKGSGIDRSAFDQIDQYFRDKNWIKLERPGKSLLTRQLDTVDRRMYDKGVTLRVRGECENRDLKTVSEADICVKLGKTKDESGAVRRGEFEARIADFEHSDLKPLRSKYPKEHFPEIHAALKGISVRDLREYFRIDCIRTRYVVEIPEEVTGLKGRRFVGELLLDDVAFVLDIPGRKGPPLVFHHDLEIECETLFKACDYDNNPDAKNYVSSPLNKDETNIAMAAVKKAILEATNNRVVINNDSKAERGFKALDRELPNLESVVQTRTGQKKGSKIQSAFRLNASNDNEGPTKIHDLLSGDYGYLFRQNRPIAMTLDM